MVTILYLTLCVIKGVGSRWKTWYWKITNSYSCLFVFIVCTLFFIVINSNIKEMFKSTWNRVTEAYF